MRFLFFALLALALPWSAPATAAEEQPSQTESVAEQAIAPEPQPEFLSQADARLNGVQIGNRTVRQSGCLAIVACFAAQLQGNGRGIRECLQMLAQNRMFTPGGELYWAAAHLLGVRMPQLYRSGDAAIREAVRYFQQGAQVLLEVTYRVRGGRLRTHWVVVNRIVDGTIFVLDPNGGIERTLSQVHGGARSVRRIVPVTSR